MNIDPNRIAPSQDFLKPGTVAFIFDCIKNQRENELPPAPIVRKDRNNQYVAIDGHNLLAVKAYLGQEIAVHVAASPDDGLPETSKENLQRNADLLEKFESSLVERDKVTRAGIGTFRDLIDQNRDLFNHHEQ